MYQDQQGVQIEPLASQVPLKSSTLHKGLPEENPEESHFGFQLGLQSSRCCLPLTALLLNPRESIIQ